MAKPLHVKDGFVEDPKIPDDAPDSGGNEGTGMAQRGYDPHADSFNPPADWEARQAFQGDYGRSSGGSAEYAGSGDYGSEAGRYSSSPGELGDPQGIDPLDVPDAEDGGDIETPETPDEDVGSEPPASPA